MLRYHPVRIGAGGVQIEQDLVNGHPGRLTVGCREHFFNVSDANFVAVVHGTNLQGLRTLESCYQHLSGERRLQMIRTRRRQPVESISLPLAGRAED